MTQARPTDVGIIDFELYIPKLFVDQDELEEFDLNDAASCGEPLWKKGKYTKGLGQVEMTFVADREDVNSLCLTAVHRLLKRKNLSPSSIGSLEVGTETLVDKSKSVKTVLMQLFEGNSNINGVDVTNACFGGTQALFNAINWVESSSWDGRYALVVTGDIAVYGDRSARCTGGAGAMAMLVGPDAALVFDSGLRVFHMAHTYDFYKPDMHSEYPVVDGPSTVQSYLCALEQCFLRYCDISRQKTGDAPKLSDFAGVIFHTPYCKLVQKAVAILAYITSNCREFSQFRSKETSELVLRSDFFNAIYALSEPLFTRLTDPSLLFAKHMGNIYTSSVYAAIVSSLICTDYTQASASPRFLVYSYGSGLASAMFSLRGTSRLPALVESLRSLRDTLLHTRTKVPPEIFMDVIRSREASYSKAPFDPKGSLDDIFPDTYYLTQIDDKFRRFYSLKA